MLDDEPEVHKPRSGSSKTTPASARSSSSSKAAQPGRGSAADSPARLPGGVPPSLELTEGQLSAVRAQLEALLPDSSFEEAQGSGAAPAADSCEGAPEEPQRVYTASCMDTYEEYDEDGEVVVPEGYVYVDHFRRAKDPEGEQAQAQEPHVLPPFLQAIMDEEDEDERAEELHAQGLWTAQLHQRQQQVQPQPGDNPMWGTGIHIPTIVVEEEEDNSEGDLSSSSEASDYDVPPRAASPEP